ncbi:ankyrin repeat domain-containing protein [Sagittula sp. NFXS13]|uniref:ankyrin repeat domain-containing protein n=1 Tax=Sagittula sp. NFXS13 TaxID=2819095 RepID=UPI0032DF84C5
MSEDHADVLSCITDSFDPNDYGGSNFSALHRAAHPKVVERLLQLGANPNARDKFDKRQSSLHHMASIGEGWGADDNERIQSIEYLIAAGADVDARDAIGGTPLKIASFMNNAEAVRTLLEAGADPNLKNQWGETPLHSAAARAGLDVVALLLDAGADPSVSSKDGAYPADLALRAENSEVTESDLMNVLINGKFQ